MVAAPRVAPRVGIQAATRAAPQVEALHLHHPRPPQQYRAITEMVAIGAPVRVVAQDIVPLLVSVAGQVKIKVI